jgi:hypothetical protein
VAILADRNVRQKENRYSSLCVETQIMSTMRCMNIPAITEATGRATKVLKKNLKAVAKREIFNRFTTEDSYTWKITLTYTSAAV